jgi:hypothetical protein
MTGRPDVADICCQPVQALLVRHFAGRAILAAPLEAAGDTRCYAV